MENDQAQIAQEIRANVAFEQLIGSLVSGAAIGGGVFFALTFGGLVLGRALSFSTLLSLLLTSLMAVLSIFLIGFIAGVIIVTPLFKALEKAKRRSAWPYIAASIGVCVFSLVALANLPRAPAPDVAVVISVFAAGLYIAFDFGRRMAPFWRAAERAEEQAVGFVRRIH